MTTMNPQSSDEAEERMTTVIADDLHIKGTITFRSSLMIKGSLEGEIISEGLLVVGPTAKIGATIVTKSLVSHGQIKGDVTASERVVLKETSVQRGNITTPYIVVENGSTFNGSCVMKREKTVRPVEETSGPGTAGEQGPGYEGHSDEAASTGEVVGEGMAVSSQESGFGYGQSDNDTAEAASEEAPVSADEAHEETASLSEAQSDRDVAASDEESKRTTESEEEEQKSKEDTGSESPLRSKWRRRELF
jgi:cytoskeletal protein CcmA (bactofilin family)